MSAPDPEGMSLLAKVIAAGTAVVAPIWGGMKWLDTRLDKKADRQAVKEAFEKLDTELGTQRGHIAKIFDQMRDAEGVSEKRHRELMMHLLERK